MRRVLVTLGLVVLGLAIASPTASAHALLASSEPAAGAAVSTSPTEVVLHFTEEPDHSLSVVHVVDQAGHAVEKGGFTADPSDARTLHQPVSTLSNGTYTVTWRTTSSVDGHTTAGSFAFGVGQAPAVGAGVSSSSSGSAPVPSAVGVAGRALLYAGLAVMVGGAVVALALRTRKFERWSVYLSIAGATSAFVGALLVGIDELHASGASLSHFLSASPGHHWQQLLLVVFACTIGVGVYVATRRRAALLATGILAAIAMLVRVASGHAAASTSPWYPVGTQWLHFVAVGAWVGALPWFVLLLVNAPADQRRALGRRFAALATVGIVVVGVTGTLRALDEVDAWNQLWHNSFGRTLLVKVGLVAVIATIGAVNHFVLTRRLPAASPRLKRTVLAEISIGVAVVLVTGLLTGLAPASSVAAAARAPQNATMVVDGNDFATTVKVRLEITPGIVGPNHFSAAITDYDTNQPVAASAVKLRFALSSRPDVASTLDLTPASGDRWEATAASIAMPGVWDVTTVITGAQGGVEVPLRVHPTIPGQQITTVATPGQPTIYNMKLIDGTQLQCYVDPGKSGKNQFHVTAFDANGNELPVDSAEAVAYGPTSGSTTLTPSRLTAGHFVAPVTLTPGTWTYAVTLTAGPRTLVGMFDDPVEG